MSRLGLSESSASGTLLTFAAVVLLLIFAKVLLIPLAFALTLSFLLLPLVVFFENRGCKRAIAVAIAATLATTALVSGTYILSRQVVSVADTLPGYRSNIEKRLASLHSSSEASLETALGIIEDLSGSIASSPSNPQSDAIPVRLVGQRSDQFMATLKLLGVFFEPLGQIGIVIVFAMYMLTNREEFRHRLLMLAGIGNLNLVTRALADATERISKYIVLQVEVNACYGLLFGVGLHFLRVPEATLWGVIAGTLRIVPFIGPLMGMVVPLVLSIAIANTWWPPVLVLSLFLVLELTTGNLIEPMLFKSRTGISELALLSSAILWFTVWGWPGLVLSTPLTACFVVLGRYVPQLSFLNSLLGSNATLSPAAHLYDRLLAMDQAEARSITDIYLKKNSLLNLYDKVILPVLGLAEEDRYKGSLTDVQSKFMLLCIGELIARLAEHEAIRPAEEPSSNSSVGIGTQRSAAREKFAIICISTGEKADDYASVMLTQLLELAGHPTVTLPSSALSEDVLALLAQAEETVVFLTALPPFAFARTREMCLRVRTQLPGNRIAVALWNSGEETDDITSRFGSARPTVTLTNLAQAVEQVNKWRRDGPH